MTRLLAVLLLLAIPSARADVLLSGPMPKIFASKAKPTPETGYTPAPTADQDISAPVVRPGKDAVIAPTLINRTANRGNPASGFVPGADYSDVMARRGRQLTGLGTTLAPAVTIRQPLQ